MPSCFLDQKDKNEAKSNHQRKQLGWQCGNDLPFLFEGGTLSQDWNGGQECMLLSSLKQLASLVVLVFSLHEASQWPCNELKKTNFSTGHGQP